MPGTASVAPIFYQPTKFYKIVLKMTWLGEIGNIGILLKIWEEIEVKILLKMTNFKDFSA